jgi:integrase
MGGGESRRPDDKSEVETGSLPVPDMARLWTVLDRERDVVRDVIRCIMLTAARRGEALGARWNEFDFGTAPWTIPASRSKNHRERTVPLSTQRSGSSSRRQLGGPALEGVQVVRMFSQAKVFGIVPRLWTVMRRLCAGWGIERGLSTTCAGAQRPR